MCSTTRAGSSVTQTRSRSAGEILPSMASVPRSQSIRPFQYSVPKRTTGKSCTFRVWMRVSASNSSSMVPKPPGKITNACAYFRNIVLRTKKYRKSIEISAYGLPPCSMGSSMLQPTESAPASLAPLLAASMIPGPPPVMIASPDSPSSLAVSTHASYWGWPGGTRADPKMLTASPILDSSSNPSTNSPMIRKTRHASSLMSRPSGRSSRRSSSVVRARCLTRSAAESGRFMSAGARVSGCGDEPAARAFEGLGVGVGRPPAELAPDALGAERVGREPEGNHPLEREVLRTRGRHAEAAQDLAARPCHVRRDHDKTGGPPHPGREPLEQLPLRERVVHGDVVGFAADRLLDREAHGDRDVAGIDDGQGVGPGSQERHHRKPEEAGERGRHQPVALAIYGGRTERGDRQAPPLLDAAGHLLRLALRAGVEVRRSQGRVDRLALVDRALDRAVHGHGGQVHDVLDPRQARRREDVSGAVHVHFPDPRPGAAHVHLRRGVDEPLASLHERHEGFGSR